MAAAQTSSPAKLDAMSRALGAAFLNHQVELLEQTVESRNTPRSFGRKGGAEWKRNSGGPKGGDGRARKMSPEAARNQPGLDADVIITDASLLIHALSYLQVALHPPKSAKKGSGLGPVIVVPLEALNTLDLLKKGSAPSAKRAREASRLLEREVGENPQIRVQRETEYVTWGDITLRASEGVPKPQPGTAGLVLEQEQSPEWARRTICCAQWEVLNVHKTIQEPKVLVAVCTSGSLPSPSKHDFRAGGALVSYWTKRANIEVLDLPADPPKPPKSRDGHRSSSETERERPGAPGKWGAGRGLSSSASANAIHPSTNPAFKTIKTRHSDGNTRGGRAGPGGGGKGLVDKPPTVQPNKVMRVLARGEKLEPDD